MSNLRESVLDNDVEKVKALISKGVDVDDTDGSDYGSPLHVAVKRGYLEIAGMLLDSGADINLKNEDMGATPLMVAVDAGQPEAVKLLLKRGAELHLTNYDGADVFLYAQGAPQQVRNELIALLNNV